MLYILSLRSRKEKKYSNQIERMVHYGGSVDTNEMMGNFHPTESSFSTASIRWLLWLFLALSSVRQPPMNESPLLTDQQRDEDNHRWAWNKKNLLLFPFCLFTDTFFTQFPNKKPNRNTLSLFQTGIIILSFIYKCTHQPHQLKAISDGFIKIGN